MSIVNYQSIFDELSAAAFASNLDEQAGTDNEYAEFRTFRMGGIRQSGKTTWLINMLKSDPVFVGVFLNSSDQANAINKGVPERQTFGNMTSLLHAIKIRVDPIYCIVIDDASTRNAQLFYSNLIHFLVEHNPRDKPIIVCLG